MTGKMPQPKAGKTMLHYLRTLCLGQQLLWSYFIWYLVITFVYFDINPRLWLSSFGIALIVGAALVISTTCWPVNLKTLDRWQTMRLFLIPFCVSSYSSLIKNKGFTLIFSPDIKTNSIAIVSILFFLTLVALIKKIPIHSHR